MRRRGGEDDEHQNEDRDEDTDGNVCAETSRASRVLDYDDDDGYMILDNDDKTLRDYGVKAESTIWVRPVPKGGTVNGKSMESFFFFCESLIHSESFDYWDYTGLSFSFAHP